MNNKVAIYCRLSEEDRNKKHKDDDSGSIQNQKLMLTEYAFNQHWQIYDIYSDDDYAGSDRNRPEFNRMIKDAMDKKFDIVLCKTQSRFTRELEVVELYIHNLFPQLGIRFVSIVDNIDTNIAGNKKTRQINGLINEWYLEDMSDSIKAALQARMKAGFFIGSFAPYGYKKDPNHKGHLIPDENTAYVVKEIFKLYNSGIGRTQIARILNERGIPSPAEYYKIEGIKKCGTGKSRVTFWKYFTVSHILENEVYIGNLIQGQYYKPTYKVAHSVPAPKEKWIRVEHTHEPLISQDDWNITRKLWKQRSKPCYVSKGMAVNKYAGVLKCAKCGYNMVTAYNNHRRYFRCHSAKYGKCCCEGTSVFESTLDKAILTEINRLKECYLDEKHVQENIDINNPLEEKKEWLLKQIKVVETKIQECKNAIKNLYIDKLKGIIDDEQFVSLSHQFTEEQKENEQQVEQYKNTISIIDSQQQHTQNKKEVVHKLLSFTEISKEMVNEMIDCIEVGGTRSNRIINIYWNF